MNANAKSNSREARLRRVAPNAPDGLIASLAGRPATEVDEILALARQAARDEVARREANRKQRARDRKRHNWYDEDQLTERSLMIVAATGRRAGGWTELRDGETEVAHTGTVDALAGLASISRRAADEIHRAIPRLREAGLKDTEIAEALGVTSAAITMKYGKRRPATPAGVSSPDNS